MNDDNVLHEGNGRALLDRCFVDRGAAGYVTLVHWATLTAERLYKALRFQTLVLIEVMLAKGITFPSIRMMRDL